MPTPRNGTWGCIISICLSPNKNQYEDTKYFKGRCKTAHKQIKNHTLLKNNLFFIIKPYITNISYKKREPHITNSYKDGLAWMHHIHASSTYLIIKLLMNYITLYLIYYLACPSLLARNNLQLHKIKDHLQLHFGSKGLVHSKLIIKP